MSSPLPLQSILYVFAAICGGITAGIALTTLIAKLGWWGGDKNKALSSLEHTVQTMGADLKADVSEIKADVREIRGTVGRQDVTLAIHGEQLTSLSKRLDDEFGRRRAAG